MTEGEIRPSFYGGLNYQSVKNVIPPYMHGVDEDLFDDFLAEAEMDVENEIGPLAATIQNGEPNRTIRAVVRDLAAARAILKLVGTDNDEGRRAGQALHEYAWERLLRWEEYAYSKTTEEGGPEGSGNLANIFPLPLFNDPRSPEPERRLGGEWPQA